MEGAEEVGERRFKSQVILSEYLYLPEKKHISNTFNSKNLKDESGEWTGREQSLN